MNQEKSLAENGRAKEQIGSYSIYKTFNELLFQIVSVQIKKQTNKEGGGTKNKVQNENQLTYCDPEM